MLTFKQWLKAYTEVYGCPPAPVMAEAAYNYAYQCGLMGEYTYVVDDDLKDHDPPEQS